MAINNDQGGQIAMSTPDIGEEWLKLYNRILDTLSPLGKLDWSDAGDYWVVDDDMGYLAQKVELQNLALLTPKLIKELQSALADFPEWCIALQVHPPELRGLKPGMGLWIYIDHVIDDLRREHLPDRIRLMKFD